MSQLASPTRIPLSQRVMDLDARISALREQQIAHQRETLASPLVDMEAYVEVQTDYAQTIHELTLDRDELLEAGWID